MKLQQGKVNTNNCHNLCFCRPGEKKWDIEGETACLIWSDVWGSGEGDAEKWHYSENSETYRRTNQKKSM